MKIQSVNYSPIYLLKTKQNRNTAFSVTLQSQGDIISFSGKKKVEVQSYTPKKLEVLFSEKQIQNRIKELAKEINKYYQKEPVTIVSVMKGALPFTMDLSKRLDMPVTMEFVRLSSRQGSRLPTGKLKEISMDLPNLDGKNVLIVEDIVGTGLTGKHIADYINSSFDTKSAKFCTFINKKAVRELDFHPDFVGFNIDDDKRFILGYGLDDKEYCRNLPFVGYDEFNTGGC